MCIYIFLYKGTILRVHLGLIIAVKYKFSGDFTSTLN